MIIGIDPGKTSGGVCVVDIGGAVIHLFGMPDSGRLHDDLWTIKENKPFAYIEKAQSFPGQGIVATFNYAQHFGEIIGLMVALHIPYELVAPITWTREMLAGTVARSTTKKIKGDKTRNIEAARRLFPEQAELRANKPHPGLVDALLIAEYGRRKRQGLKSVG